MKSNISILESTVRIFIAILIAAAGGVLNHWFGVLAIIPFVTGLAGWCPIYAAMGRHTCEHDPYAEHGEKKAHSVDSSEAHSGTAAAA